MTRTILVGLIVEAPDDFPMNGDEIADAVLAAVERGLGGAEGSLASGSELVRDDGLVVCAPLAEEV